MAEVQSRPKVLPSETVHIGTGCGDLAVTISFLNGKPFEIFAKLGKQGGCFAAQNEAISRAISLGLRAGVPLSEYHEHLRDIKCNNRTFDDGEDIQSCPDAMSKVMKKFINDTRG
jgi:ribonucleoside-diphosphate reductase alpha chain